MCLESNFFIEQLRWKVNRLFNANLGGLFRESFCSGVGNGGGKTPPS